MNGGGIVHKLAIAPGGSKADLARGGNRRLVQPMSKTFHNSDNPNLSGGGEDNLETTSPSMRSRLASSVYTGAGLLSIATGVIWGDLCCNRLGLRQCRFTEVNALHGFVRLAKSAALRAANCSCSHSPS